MWLLDPKNNKQSVTLTMTTIVFGVLLISFALEMSDVVKTPHGLIEMFWGLMALYAYRRTDLRTKSFKLSNETTQEKKKEVL
jgi:hypothetical protein